MPYIFLTRFFEKNTALTRAVWHAQSKGKITQANMVSGGALMHANNKFFAEVCTKENFN